MLLARKMVARLTPFLEAMAERVSPARTVYVRDAPADLERVV